MRLNGPGSQIKVRYDSELDLRVGEEIALKDGNGHFGKKYFYYFRKERERETSMLKENL